MASSTITLTLPRPGPRAWLAAGLLGGLLIAQAAGPALGPRPALATATDGTKEHTISVSGTGRVVLTPDTADLRLGVTVTAKTVKDARAGAASAMTAVIAAVRKLGIAERDIQTATLSLQPVYDYSGGTNPPRRTGFSLNNTIAVTVRDLDVVGDVIDDALAAGATSLDGVGFRVDDQEAAERQARAAAMAEAKAKADALAQAAGVTISGVASISESAAAVPYPIYYGAMAGAADRNVATPVQAGTSEVVISVAVVYLIG